MDELFAYDENKGLFKEILKQSFVMEGRYHVSYMNGQDLNTNNLGNLIAELPIKKYPLTVCLSPISQINTSLDGQTKEDFIFNLIFLCKSYNVANGINDKTRKAVHDIPYDWKDMKQCAMDFLIMLDKITRQKKLANGLPVCTQFNINLNSINVKRLSKFNEDRVSGVWVSFAANMFGSDCGIMDYTLASIDLITIPNEVIHEQHKHG